MLLSKRDVVLPEPFEKQENKKDRRKQKRPKRAIRVDKLSAEEEKIVEENKEASEKSKKKKPGKTRKEKMQYFDFENLETPEQIAENKEIVKKMRQLAKRENESPELAQTSKERRLRKSPDWYGQRIPIATIDRPKKK